jgi:hypothetical protein
LSADRDGRRVFRRGEAAPSCAAVSDAAASRAGRVALESIAIAFILTLLLTFVLAGLQSAEINVASLRDEVGTFMLFFWACAYLFSVSRYR